MIVGTEWLIEATGCDTAVLRDESALRNVLDKVIADLGLIVVGSVWHKFEGEGGVTGLIALTESHLACHTYPEYQTATFNLYCCRTRPEWNWDANLKTALAAASVSVTKVERGKASNADVPSAVRSASRTPVADNKQDTGRKYVTFGEATLRTRGRLPHLEKDDGIYFVTFRLADSLPAQLLEELQLERERAETVLPNLSRELSILEKKRLDWLYSEKVNQYLDNNYGECLLKQTKAAEIIANALEHFDGTRYHLHAWCVMPNHVHVVFRPIQRHKLDEILHSWKSFTAHEINKLFRRSGELWQREYYDHLVRNEKEFDAMVKYTLDNPIKAGLSNWRWVGGFGKYRVDAVAV